MNKSLPIWKQPTVTKPCKCDDCPSACCWDVCITIKDSPILEADDVDHVRWLLMHENLSVWTDSERWDAVFHTRCKNVTQTAGGQYRCGIYERRPHVCRDFSNETCVEKELMLYGEKPEDWLMFDSVEEFDAWWEKTLREQRVPRAWQTHRNGKRQFETAEKPTRAELESLRNAGDGASNVARLRGVAGRVRSRPK